MGPLLGQSLNVHEYDDYVHEYDDQDRDVISSVDKAVETKVVYYYTMGEINHDVQEHNNHDDLPAVYLAVEI